VGAVNSPEVPRQPPEASRVRLGKSGDAAFGGGDVRAAF
jgi:hypothetical protein